MSHSETIYAKDKWITGGCYVCIKEGDIISIILNLSEAEMKFELNGKDISVMVQNIEKSDDIKYRLIVVMHDMNNCVEILKYRQR